MRGTLCDQADERPGDDADDIRQRAARLRVPDKNNCKSALLIASATLLRPTHVEEEDDDVEEEDDDDFPPTCCGAQVTRWSWFVGDVTSPVARAGHELARTLPGWRLRSGPIFTRSTGTRPRP